MFGFKASRLQGFKAIIPEVLDLSHPISVKGLLSYLVTFVFISSCSFPPTLSAEESQSATETQSSSEKVAKDNQTPATPSEKKPVRVESPPVQPKAPAEADPSPQPKPEDKKVLLEKFLGDMKPILEQATKVETYLVGSEPKPEVPEESKLGGYPVLSGPVNLKPEQVKAIQTLVLDGNNYFWGPLAKKCMLAPTVAFRFIKGNQEVSILISDYCNLWSFAYQNKLGTQDYAPVADKVKPLLTELFPTEFPAKP